MASKKGMSCAQSCNNVTKKGMQPKGNLGVKKTITPLKKITFKKK